MLTKFTRNSLVAAALAATAITSVPASAQRVEPMRFELQPSGSGAQTTLTVTNTRPFPITIEVVPSTLSISSEGEETLEPAEDDFLIFPPQAVIEANETQSIRVRYIGDPGLDASRAYRIGVNQLPIDMREDGESGVSVTVNFATLANIVPDGTRSDLEVSEVSPVEDGRWRILVSNNGTRYARMSDLDLRFSQGSNVEDVRSSKTQGWFDNNLILPGGQLYVTLPAQAGFDPGQTTIALVDPS